MGKNCGKNFARYNFINCMGYELGKLGHEVIYLADDYLYKIVPQYDFINCFHDKKPINIKQIEYEFDPDFIYIEQMYYRLNRDEVKCPVIYQHREYTHFPDIVNPDILLASYFWRLRAFEFYLPWEYHNIPYKDYNFVAVDTVTVKPVDEKTLDGITHIGLRIPMWQFREANGPFGDMVMENQEIFWAECIDKGYCRHIPHGLNTKDFITMLGRCEALLYDAGRFAGLSRRLFEAMASKTLCIIKVHTKLQENLYKKVGLTDEMCYFIQKPDEIKDILKEWHADKEIAEVTRKAKTNRAYEWVIANHTYKVRAKELIKKFEEFKDGITKDYKFMGFGLKHKITIEEGEVVAN